MADLRMLAEEDAINEHRFLPPDVRLAVLR